MENNVIILAGGQGKRMKADIPKALCEVLGEPMLEWVISAAKNANIDNISVVTGFENEKIDEYLNGRYQTYYQAERLGTGHAVMQAEYFLKENIEGNTLVLCGDAPFIDSETIKGALSSHNKNDNAVTVITAILPNPFGYGRIIRDDDGIKGIVEQKDCTPSQLAITEINSGAFWFKTKELVDVLYDISPNNSQGEYYLTDAVALLIKKGMRADSYITENSNVVLGANDRKGLLHLNDVARMEIINKHLENGIDFTCTDGVIIGKNVMIGSGTSIQPGTQLSGFTTIGENCVIGPNTIISNCAVGNGTKLNYVQAYQSKIGKNVKMGPFVHIRPNCEIKDGVKIGDFVEVKNSVIGEFTSMSHLTYVGDSDVGSGVNFGCGVVTVNYDGVKKARTVVGDDAFIGCNTNLVAPVNVGKGAYTAAGTTVTKTVPDGSLAIGRPDFKIIEGYATRKFKGKAKK